MSNENSNNGDAPTNDKHRKPDGYIQIEKIDSNGRKNTYDVGAVWNSKNDYQTGQSMYGRVIIEPREAREMRQAQREENKQVQQETPAHEQGHGH